MRSDKLVQVIRLLLTRHFADTPIATSSTGFEFLSGERYGWVLMPIDEFAVLLH